MRESMNRRGPDGAGMWTSDDGDIGFAHRRLAILDLSVRAAQPMSSSDGSVQLVFNGEIYNHPELRRWAEARGAKYRTTSDTETLLHLYELAGDAFVGLLRGMFAFALWDTRERKLLLARDAFGIKPLYYAADAQGLRFASQVKALIAGGVSSDRSVAGMASFHLWGYVTEPHTWYRAIRALPSGAVMHWRPGSSPQIIKYCDPLAPLRDPAAMADDMPSFHGALLDSVRHHLLADVPVGLFLSAGVDSGALLSLASECVDRPSIRAITLGFDEYSGTPRDETSVACQVAKRFNVSHRVVTLHRADFLDERSALLTAMDQPTIDGSNTYFVSRAAAQTGLRVALSGVGGDELFGGYASFHQVPSIAHRLKWIPKRTGRLARRVLTPFVSRLSSPKFAGVLEYGSDVTGAYLLRRALFMPWELPEVMGERDAIEGLDELDVMRSLETVIEGVAAPYDQVMALEFSIYLRNCLLRDADWAGMAHGLEIRTPLVDACLFAQLAALRRARGGTPWRKRDLALAPLQPLPLSFLKRPKSGFNFPVREWLPRETQNTRPQASWGRGHRGWARVLATKFGRFS